MKTTEKLRLQYGRSFPLDGRLVGDIGEALVQKFFEVKLLPENNHIHDAQEKESGRLIQIKSSMKYNFSFPYDRDPDYYMAVHINPDATLEIIYNGPGKPIRDYIIKIGNKDYKQTWYPLTANTLINLNKTIAIQDRIKERTAK
ncbi:DUF6998 domain-containing protein [Robiginitalea biformata]|uniref:DUF6998 domain-containing protein n=1 Tax=Robiginitalea biformata TaxID=252307 RepID=UPI003B59D77D